VFVLIRPRGGNFVYTSDEIQIMVEDIHIFKSIGIHGVVIGCLLENGEIHKEHLSTLIDAALPLPNITFHRAIDVSNDLLNNTLVIQNEFPNVNRILT
jgi:copper homeostasis protein